MKRCKTCEKELSAGNKSGYCRKHVAAHNAKNPEIGAKISEGIKRALEGNPERLAQLRYRAAKLSNRPDVVQRRTERFRKDQVWKLGFAASRDPEVRARAGRTLSERRLAWCAPHLRAEYLELVCDRGVPAAEAKIIIARKEAQENGVELV
ncbi:MAG: hypothetical protein CL804_03555 [Citromicrobium sp.]|nr:hypothetical protein [Citromicrobium sp.]